MPYRRRYNNRRRFRPRRKNAMQKTQQLVQGKAQRPWYTYTYPYVAKSLYGLISHLNVETKERYNSFDNVIDPIAATNTATIDLTNTGRGTGASNRIGNSIKTLSLQLKMLFEKSSTNSNVNIIRFIIYVDKQDSTANPATLGDILQDGTNMLSLTNQENTDRFVILKDKYFTLSDASNRDTYISKFYKKLNFHTRYTVGADTPAENNIFLIAFTNQVSDTSGLLIQSKLRFTDN